MADGYEDVAEMMAELREKRGWSTDMINDGATFEVDVSVGNEGRMQKVLIHTLSKDVDGNDKIIIESRCCAIKDVQAKSGMLRKKKGTTHLGLLEKNFKSDYVYFVADPDEGTIFSQATRFLENITFKELELLIVACAAQADALEEEKYGDCDEE